MTNRLLKKMADDFEAERNFIINRMDTYTNIINEYETYLSKVQYRIEQYLEALKNQSDDVINQLKFSYHSINILKFYFNSIQNLKDRIESNLPEIKKMIDEHKFQARGLK